MDTVYPPAASALSRGRRRRAGGLRLRHRTMPVTFAEIKEVDEEKDEGEEARGASVASVASAEERRRRPDFLDERLGREFVEFRKRRARRDLLREPDEIPASTPSSPPTSPSSSRATSEPS